MSELSDSYVLRVLLATRTSAQAVDAVARRWRWVRASMCDPYGPELHYMRGPGPKWREKHGRGAGGERMPDSRPAKRRRSSRAAQSASTTDDLCAWVRGGMR